MSKLFFDKFIIFEEIEVELKKLNLDLTQRRELEHLIDELICHRVLDKVLTYLPQKHHEEFLNKFHKVPYDENLLTYLNEKIEDSVEQHIKNEITKLKKEILEDIKQKKK